MVAINVREIPKESHHLDLHSPYYPCTTRVASAAKSLLISGRFSPAASVGVTAGVELELEGVLLAVLVWEVQVEEFQADEEEELDHDEEEIEEEVQEEEEDGALLVDVDV